MSQDGASINSTLNSGGLPPGSGEVGTKLADTTDADDLTPTATATATATEEEKQLTGTTQDGTLPLAQPTTASARTSGNVTPRSLEKNMAKAAAKAKKEAEAAATKSNDAMERLAERAATKAAEKTVDVMLPKIKEEVNQVIDTRFEEQEAKLDAKLEKRFAQQDAKLDSLKTEQEKTQQQRPTDPASSRGQAMDGRFHQDVALSTTLSQPTLVSLAATLVSTNLHQSGIVQGNFDKTFEDKDKMKLLTEQKKFANDVPYLNLSHSPTAKKIRTFLDECAMKHEAKLAQEDGRQALRAECNRLRIKLAAARAALPTLEPHLATDYPLIEGIAASPLGVCTVPAMYETIIYLLECEPAHIVADYQAVLSHFLELSTPVLPDSKATQDLALAETTLKTMHESFKNGTFCGFAGSKTDDIARLAKAHDAKDKKNEVKITKAEAKTAELVVEKSEVKAELTTAQARVKQLEADLAKSKQTEVKLQKTIVSKDATIVSQDATIKAAAAAQ